MKLLLDTNVCIDVLRGRPEIVKRFQQYSPDDLCISSISVSELIQGAGRAPEAYRTMERRKVSTFLGIMKTVTFDAECGVLAGDINAVLLNWGTPVGVMDVFIAAIALRLKLPLATNNVRDFSKISGLELIDWRQ